jgi:hypothetical protein
MVGLGVLTKNFLIVALENVLVELGGARLRRGWGAKG